MPDTPITFSFAEALPFYKSRPADRADLLQATCLHFWGAARQASSLAQPLDTCLQCTYSVDSAQKYKPGLSLS